MKASRKKVRAVSKNVPIEHKGMTTAAELRERNREIADRFENEIMRRVGETAIAKLGWVLKVLSNQPHTPGDWDNLQLEMAVFCGEHSALAGHAVVPTKEEASQIREMFGSLIKKAVERKEFVVSATPPTQMGWHGRSSHKGLEPVKLVYARRRGEIEPETDGFWIRSPVRQDDWQEMAKEALVNLIVQAGHLVRECRAPAPRSDKPCGTWFVASRRTRTYCSPRCMTRATTKAWRKEAR